MLGAVPETAGRRASASCPGADADALLPPACRHWCGDLRWCRSGFSDPRWCRSWFRRSVQVAVVLRAAQVRSVRRADVPVTVACTETAVPRSCRVSRSTCGNYRAVTGGPRVPRPEVSSGRGEISGSLPATRQLGAHGGGPASAARSAVTARRTLDTDRRSESSAPRISTAPTGIATTWVASMIAAECAPWWWPGPAVRARWAIACPAVSSSITCVRPGRSGNARASAPINAHAPSSRVTEEDPGATVPPPSAWAAILTAPHAEPTNAPRNEATADPDERTHPYYGQS